jgi:hypothetical protein
LFGWLIIDVDNNKRQDLLAAISGGVNMERKTVGTILGLCGAVLVLAGSPTVKADGHEAEKEQLPQVFKLSNRGGGMSDELLFRLQTVTAVNRLQAAAQSDEELNALKYEDAMAALKAVGVEWSGDTQVRISRDDKANEDVVTISGPSVDAVVRYDDKGEQIVNKEAESMSSRGDYVDQAYQCCWGVGYAYSCYNPGQCTTSVCVEWVELDNSGGASSMARNINIDTSYCSRWEPYPTCYSPYLTPGGEAPCGY